MKTKKTIEFRYFPHNVKIWAAQMAIAINGGNWDTDYTEAQKIGWCLNIEWVLENKDKIFAK